MEIIVCVIAVALFVFMLVFLINVFVKKQKPADKAKDSKTEDNAKTDDKKVEEIPDILKEVTQGNYMYDIANENDDISQDAMVENNDIKAEDIKTKQESKVEESYEKIEAIEDDYREDKLLNTQAILNDLDGVEDDDQADEVKEIKGLSNKTKALIISDLLKRKNK